MSYQKSTFHPTLRVHFGPAITSLVARQPQVACLKNHTRPLQEKTGQGGLNTRRWASFCFHFSWSSSPNCLIFLLDSNYSAKIYFSHIIINCQKYLLFPQLHHSPVHHYQSCLQNAFETYQCKCQYKHMYTNMANNDTTEASQ